MRNRFRVSWQPFSADSKSPSEQLPWVEVPDEAYADRKVRTRTIVFPRPLISRRRLSTFVGASLAVLTKLIRDVVLLMATSATPRTAKTLAANCKTVHVVSPSATYADAGTLRGSKVEAG